MCAPPPRRWERVAPLGESRADGSGRESGGAGRAAPREGVVLICPAPLGGRCALSGGERRRFPGRFTPLASPLRRTTAGATCLCGDAVSCPQSRSEVIVVFVVAVSGRYRCTSLRLTSVWYQTEHMVTAVFGVVVFSQLGRFCPPLAVGRRRSAAGDACGRAKRGPFYSLHRARRPAASRPTIITHREAGGRQ